MGSTTLSVQTPALLGTVISGVTAVASSETCTIQAATAQSSLDFKSLMIRITAVGGSVTPTLRAGTEYSGVNLGNKALTAIASSASAIIGGQDFEGARFLSSGNTLIIAFTGTGTASIEAYQKPKASE